MAEPEKEAAPADERVDFIGAYVCVQFRLRIERWTKFMSDAENRQIVMDFLNDDAIHRLIIMANAAGALVAMYEFSPLAKTKVLYFVRKSRAGALPKKGIREALTFGSISARPISDLSILVDECFVPVLTNPQNSGDWPDVVRKDMDNELQEMRNHVAEVRGNITNNTILPLPITIAQVMTDAEKYIESPDQCDMNIRRSLEQIVCKWSVTISEVISDSHKRIFVDQLRPLPADELLFWQRRQANLENIFKQLRDERVRTIARLLEAVESTFLTSFSDTFRSVVEALHEARDVTLYLLPVLAFCDKFQMADFEDSRVQLKQLMTALCVMWSTSRYYCSNDRMLHLFKLVHNMLIEQVRTSFDPSGAFQAEVVDSLKTIERIIAVMDYYRLIHAEFRADLESFVRADDEHKPVMWSFRPDEAFRELNMFTDRLNDLRAIFDTATEFSKLDRIEIGGVNGRNINRNLRTILGDFETMYREWNGVCTKYDILEVVPDQTKGFLEAKASYDKGALHQERKLAAQMGLAFEQCVTTEQLTTLIQMVGSLMHMPVIDEEVNMYYKEVVRLYGLDVELVKTTYDAGLEAIAEKGVQAILDPGQAPVSGLLKWLQKLRARLTVPLENYPYLDFDLFDNEHGRYVMGQYEEMLALLNGHQAKALDEWNAKITNRIPELLAMYLLARESPSRLQTNFHDELEEALRETRTLTVMEIENICVRARDLAERYDELHVLRLKLIRIVQWYNEVSDKSQPCEIAMLAQEKRMLDGKLDSLIDKMTWDSYDTEFVDQVYTLVKDYHTRVMRAQENVRKIMESIDTWGLVPLFQRKDGQTDTLLELSNRFNASESRLRDCMITKRLIEKFVQDENYRLYFNVPFSCPCSSDESEESENEDDVDKRAMRRSRVGPTGGPQVLPVTAEELAKLQAPFVSNLVREDWKNVLYHEYEKYVDQLVGNAIMNAVIISVRYIKNEMENRLDHNAPVFEVKYELQNKQAVFIPHLDTSITATGGFMALINEIMMDIYSMCDMVKRIAPVTDNPDETYESMLRERKDIEELKGAIVSMTKKTALNCLMYVSKFHVYRDKYEQDREVQLQQFLKYGRLLTRQEQEWLEEGSEEFKVKEQKPTLDNFREQISTHKKLREEVEKMEEFKDIDIWMRIRIKGFKYALINELQSWGLLFKNYLKNQVVDSLQELEDFCEEAFRIMGLEQDKDNLERLLETMSMLNKIEDRSIETDRMFEPLKSIADMLKEYQFVFEDRIYVQFVDLPETWKKVKNMAVNMKQVIAPLQAYQVDLIGKRVSLFEARIRLYRVQFLEQSFFTAHCPTVYEKLDKVNLDLTGFEETVESLKHSTSLFSLQAPSDVSLQKCRREACLLKELWDFVHIVRSNIDDWKNTKWSKIDVEEMDTECKRIQKEMRTMDKEMRTWDPFVHTDNSLKNLMTSLRAIVDLQNTAIRDRHWSELMDSTRVKVDINEKTTLDDLLRLELHRYEETIRDIVDKSVKEESMEKTLKDLTNTWRDMNFEYEKHPRTGMMLIRIREEIIEVLEDHQNQLQNMLSSKYITHFATEVGRWQVQLGNADTVCASWTEVQRKWMYLESIFVGSKDIRQQLPEDSQRFDNIDKEFRGLLDSVKDESNVVKVTNRPGLVKKLDDLSDMLILCEKALNEYLETKRIAFPRFYFLAAPDMLDILSNGNQPELVCVHLPKLYDSLSNMVLSGTIASAMISKEKERVEYKKRVDCSGQVEVWLNRVTDEMRASLLGIFAEAVKIYPEHKREKFLFMFPAQVSLVTSQIMWSHETNQSFALLEEGDENALKIYQRKQIQMLNALIVLLLSNLTANQRTQIVAVCTIDVHQRDVVATMIFKRVESSLAFHWQAQLRHRWDHKLHNCFANICDAQFKYDYEYQGIADRLVITPLTDRCYITLSQSLHLCMGGAPAGPAGTGKTETTKDLGKALGVMVYVFNCSEQMDYKSCGNMYKGLAQTGAWGCFDEFNRISVEVLSVVAVQVKSILDAIKMRRRTFNFMGDIIKLTPTVGMFITMNPGYAGRTELPENLKALFRPCAMCVPDFALISEIQLVSGGFQDARQLSQKFIALYKQCKELLSKQDHYDWGLRAVKSLLVVAGALKRSDPDRPEDQVLMRALRDFNTPKIVTEDVPIFMGLIGDLFPNLDVPRKRDDEFEKTIRKSALDQKLQPDKGFILKVVQLEELFAVRHSVFVVGFAGTGKSEVWKTLNKTYANQKRKPYYNDLNPKAVTNDELFGVINPATREWKDGLFSVIMRDQVRMGGEGPKWIVLDGDIDPMWIESLNTLMDDNKILTLASNERIALQKEMRLLFEIGGLKTATPATVSRAGILYINPQDLGWNPFVSSWLETRPAPERSTLIVLFDKYVPLLLDVMKNKLKKITPISEMAQIHMTCHLLDCVYTPQNLPPDCPKDWYELYFVFAIIWGFGSALFQDQIIDWRNEFNKWWHNEFKTVKFPSTGTVFNFFIDPETKQFLPWTKLVGDYELDPDIPLQSALVPTAETTRMRYFMDLLVERKHPVMMVGGSGSGKSVIMADKLNTLSTQYAVTNLPFNFYTTSMVLQQQLERPLEKKAGKLYAPPAGKKMVFFIDDMNMPEVDKYGTVQPHTLVRQHMDYQHWYDRTKLSLKDIGNCQFVACMNPTAGSFTIDPRLQRHFATFAVSFPGADAMFHVYNSILTQHLQTPAHKFPARILKCVEALVTTAVAAHQRMNQLFLPTVVKFHYNFNMRDLANIFSGMMFAVGECCQTANQLISLYVHEAYRVYGDKLVSQEDIDIFGKMMVEFIKKGIENIEEPKIFLKPLVLFHYARGLNDPLYFPVKDWNELGKVLQEAQLGYNDMIGAMNLVLFEDAMGHIARISRILANDRGYALLIGVGGSGKQSLTRLSAFITGLDVSQTQLRKGFTVNDLRADLAVLYLKAGVKNASCCYLMTDSQVAEEQFLVLINDMLASGEIPDLFANDEQENIVNAMRNEVKQSGLIDSRENCWTHFINKVRRQLKVVLCFSPVGSTLRVRGRKFPALVNCTAIDWFHEWPKSALESVSTRFLSAIEVLPESLVDPISRFMAYVHTTVNNMSQVYFTNERRYNYTTPKSFLELIALYDKLLVGHTTDMASQIKRLDVGLIKLADVSVRADELKGTLATQEVELAVKKGIADQQYAIVSAENEKVGKEKAVASETEKEVRIVEETVSVQSKICAEDLKKAEPIMMAAIAALDTLDKNNLTELKSFGTPAPAIVDVAAAVLVLFSNKGPLPKDRSWKACKAMMGNVGQFLDKLKNYDKKNIQPSVVAALMPYLDKDDFVPDIIRGKSSAAAGLCEWVINIHKFYVVYLDVGPKERALAKAEQDLANATKKLEDLNVRLSELQETLNALQSKLDAASAEKAACQAQADLTQFTIELAYRLVSGLASEKIRWGKSIIDYRANIGLLPGDVLLVSCFISYVGCFMRRYRLELQEKMWMPTFKTMTPPIPIGQRADPLELICDGAQIATWNNQGLPTDRMSAENATILTNSARWPLMIDPQLQGIKWIKNKYGDTLSVVRLTHRNYLDTIEKAVSKGSVLLIENIGENIDAVLDPLLGRQLIKKGKCVKMGDKEVEYNPNFRMILQTRLANPHYKPEMQAQATLINFTVTRDGLEEQLLGAVVKAERPDLETLKSSITQEQNDNKITLKTLEDNLLFQLSNAGENVLEDPSMVINLEKTKITSAEIEVKVQQGLSTSKQIDESREFYRAAAERASIIYFVLNDLNKVNMIYQFSLKAFTVVFTSAIINTPQAESLSDRVANLVDSITFEVFMYTSRAMFERDKLILMAQLSIQIQLQAQLIEQRDLDFLLRFPYMPNQNSPVEFLSNVGWGGVRALAMMDTYAGLDKEIEGYSKRWQNFADLEAPEQEKLPGEWKAKAPVQRLCIMRCLRPDRMTYAVRLFVVESMGQRYVDARSPPFPETFKESSATTHTFFTLSPGVNPLRDVEALGNKMKFSFINGNFYNVSLGQGQEIVAERAIDVASAQGHWVMLQNIHLVARWLPTLDKKIEASLEGSHPDYRLFLSAEPAPAAEFHIIPQGVLESAIKITNEPPTGMQANLHKALDNFNQDSLEMCSKETDFKAILFGLCYFHAVVAERRKFGAQGWNRSYPFNEGDLTISVNVLLNYLEANARVPWEDLRYLFGEIMYGGHITDDWDRRLCATYLEEYMQPAMIDGDMYLAPGFLCPPNMDYVSYHRYIDEELPGESPQLYGLHSNAEIGVLTTLSELMFRTIFELQPRGSGDGGGASGMSKEDISKQIIEDIVDRIPDEFNMLEIMARVEDRSPYIIVAFQECDRMNMLMREIKRGLMELFAGLKGELTITPNMEKLDDDLQLDKVPEKWTVLAYPSQLGLQSWYADLQVRLGELQAWSMDFNLPSTVWLSGFFNPQSLLTAIMQQTARKNSWPLDRMCLNVDVTKKWRSDITSAPREGAFVRGLYMEGARWNMMTGSISDSRMKELFPPVPVVYVRAVTLDKKDVRNVYECPLYKTRMRGPTYVWDFNLKTKEKASKWTLGGVCLLLQV